MSLFIIETSLFLWGGAASMYRFPGWGGNMDKTLGACVTPVHGPTPTYMRTHAFNAHAHTEREAYVHTQPEGYSTEAVARDLAVRHQLAKQRFAAGCGEWRGLRLGNGRSLHSPSSSRELHRSLIIWN